MATAPPIIVQMTDQRRTIQALRLVCALAQSSGGEVALVKFCPAYYVQWLGTDFCKPRFSAQDRVLLQICQELAKGYGVELSASISYYVTFTDAIVEAVTYLGAQGAFVTLSRSVEPLKRFDLWLLRRRLARHHCKLYTLDTAALVSEPEPAVAAAGGR